MDQERNAAHRHGRFSEEGLHDEQWGGDVDLDDGFVVEGEDVAEEPAEWEPTGQEVVQTLVTAFAEAFNARDLDELQSLIATDAELPGIGEDRDGFAAAVGDFWSRSPGVLATVGWFEEAPVIVLWNRDDARWWHCGVITVEVDENTVSCAELVEGGSILDEVVADEPELEHEEGSIWEEWEEGVID